MKPANNPIQIKRHACRMTPKQADEVVSTVADLIVSYLKTHGVPAEERARKEETDE